MELAVGEALISFLDAKGTPEITQRAFVIPPASQIGPITPEDRRTLIDGSIVAGVYEKLIDRESAFEVLRGRAGGGHAMPENAPNSAPEPSVPGRTADQPSAAGGMWGGLRDILFGTTGPRGGHHEGIVDGVARSAARTVGSAVAREIVRGVLGSLLGGGRR